MSLSKAGLVVVAALALAGCNAAEQKQLSPAAHGKSAVHVKVTEIAKKHGVPPALAHGVTRVESRYDCRAVNRKSNATGAMQVLPRTARGVGVHGNLKDCRTGIEAGMRYLKIALQKSGGDWCGAATLYNRGVAARPVKSQYCRLVLAQSGRVER